MNTRGFTLIELVVALVISSFLAGVIFQLLRGQERFFGIQSAREEVQQNGRAALELISAELRGANAEGIVSAEEASIQFRVPRAWGLVCNIVGTNNDSRAVVFPGSALTAFKEGSENVAIRDSLPAAAPRWRFAAVTDATSTSGAAAVTACAPLIPDAGQVQVRSLALASGAGATIPLQVGEPAYLFDVVRYDAGSSNVDGQWLRRTDAGTPQPLAGPLAVDGNVPVFRLRYFAADGTLLGTPVADPSQIAQVEIKVKTMSRSDDPRQEFVDSTRVHLRN